MELFQIRKSYYNIRSFRISKSFMDEYRVQAGPIDLLVRQGKEESLHNATLHANGTIAKCAVIYSQCGLATGDEIEISYNDKTSSLDLVVPTKETINGVEHDLLQDNAKNLVFDQKSLRHIHFDVFGPEILDRWVPANETDVFFVFGFLQDFTDFTYCCGMSQEIIKKLKYKFKDGTSKPDAIIIESITGAYLVAEFKKYSSAFTNNHHKDDVDALIVWEDDAKSREDLPRLVIEMKTIARDAAATAFSGK